MNRTSERLIDTQYNTNTLVLIKIKNNKNSTYYMNFNLHQITLLKVEERDVNP